MANKWITFVKQWAAHHNVSYREALKNPQMKADYHRHKESGSGIISDAYHHVVHKATKLKEHVQAGVHVAIHGRDGLPPSMQKVLDQYGDNSVVALTIGRNPLHTALTGALDAMSFGQFSKNNPYDKLFHLQVVVKLDDGRQLTFEKTQSPSLWVGAPSSKDLQWCPVTLPHELTLHDLVMNTYHHMGNSKFNGYSSKENNCQYFVMAILDGNHLNNHSYTEFTKQDTYQLFEGLDGLRKITNTVTDLAGAADAVMQGGDIGGHGYWTPTNPLGYKPYQRAGGDLATPKRRRQPLGFEGAFIQKGTAAQNIAPSDADRAARFFGGRIAGVGRY